MYQQHCMSSYLFKVYPLCWIPTILSCSRIAILGGSGNFDEFDESVWIHQILTNQHIQLVLKWGFIKVSFCQSLATIVQ